MQNRNDTYPAVLQFIRPIVVPTGPGAMDRARDATEIAVHRNTHPPTLMQVHSSPDAEILIAP